MDNLLLIFVSALLGVVIILNIIATIIVSRTYFLVKERRYYQIIFIWLVPFVGSILAIYLNRQEYFEKQKKDEVGNHPNITDKQAMEFDLAADDQGSFGGFDD